MKKIAVVTATRAEYGLLRWTIEALRAEPCFDLCLIVAGTHLSPAFGETWRQIEADGLRIDRKIDYLSEDRSPAGIAREMGVCAQRFVDTLSEVRPDLLLVLGDRYELLPICNSALILGIPIAHISGGDVTVGAIDNEIRNAVTMMSVLHFPGTQESAERIVRMRGSAEGVCSVGEPGLEQCRRLTLLSREELARDLGLDPARQWVSFSYHPQTRGNIKSDLAEVSQLLDFLLDQASVEVVATRANADPGGEQINDLLERRAGGRLHLHASLGQLRFLSLLKESYCCIGNSSSGIVEAPFFGTPAINVGRRQEGRHLCANVISLPSAYGLAAAWATVDAHRIRDNWYGDGHTSERIVRQLKEWFER